MLQGIQFSLYFLINNKGIYSYLQNFEVCSGMCRKQKSILYVKRKNNSLKSRKTPIVWKGVFCFLGVSYRMMIYAFWVVCSIYYLLFLYNYQKRTNLKKNVP